MKMDAARKQFALQHLKELIDTIPRQATVSAPEYRAWRQSTIMTLGSIYGHDSSVVKKFDGIWFHPSAMVRGADNSGAMRAAYERGCAEADGMLGALLNATRYEPEDAAPTQPPTLGTTKAANTRKIFVVHGHDGGLKNAVARYIEKLGLDAIILHERPDRGRTIIEKFEQESDVEYAVVLATADDLAERAKVLRAKFPSLKESDLEERARQNVVFELGFFVGKHGRGHVTLITNSNVILPSDFSGVLYTHIDQWQKKLVDELSAAGFDFTDQQILAALRIQ
jgi:predicted nucleotide-binding protein